MYVSSTLSYLVRTVILLYLINSTSAYRKQNLTVKNDYTSEISEKARKDFRSPRRSSADKSLRESDHKVNFLLREGHHASLEIPRGNKHDVDERFEKAELQNLSTGEAKKNDTSQTGVVKRTKRCLLTMMALGGIASMAADWLLPPEPKWTPPPTTITTARPVWHPPPPVYQPPKPVYQPQSPVYQPQSPVYQPPKPVNQPPPPVHQPPKPVYQPPSPVYQPPKPVYQPPPPVHQPPPTTTTAARPVYQPPKPVYQPPSPVYQPPKPVYQPPPPVYQPPKPVYQPPPPVHQLPPTTTTAARPVYQPPPTTTTTARPVYQPPPPVYQLPPTTTTTTTTTTRPPPTTTITEEPTTTTMHPTIDSTTLLPDVPTTIWTPYKLAGVDTSIAPEDPQRKFQEPASEYDRTKLKIIRDKWINATGGATEMGLIVVDGVPEYNISTATFVTKTEKNTAFNDIEVLEFLHPLTEEKIIVPLHGGDEYVNPETGEVFIIVVDNAGRTFLIFKGIGHSIAEKYPDGNSGEDTWNIIVNEPTNIERVTKWGSIVVGGVPKYNLSEGTIVNKPQKATSLNGTEVLEFEHPFTNETVQVPLNGGDEFVKRHTGEVYIIFVDNQNRTILIFKGIDHSITGQYPDRTSGEDIWNITVNETTSIERVTKWGSIVVGGVPKYNISEGTIVNKCEKKINANGTQVLEFVHPFTNEIVEVPLNGGDEFVKRKTREVYIIFVDIYGRTLLIFKGIDHSITEKYPDGNSSEDTWNIIVNETTNIERVTKWGSIVVGGVPKYNISEGTIVNKSEKKTNSNGTEVLEFVHPFTNDIVEVPLNGGDEFVKRKTREVYIIFVDIYGRTLLIFKGIDHSITEKYPDLNSNEATWNVIVNETTNIVTKWGSIVIRGVPKYNISEATIVNETEQKTDSNGTEVLEFVHPFTNETVQVSLNRGDEFVRRKTLEVFKIFVDIYGRTLLIFKGIGHSIAEKYPDGNNGEDGWNIIVNGTTNNVHVTKWGSLVVGGVPKYNISEATIVNETARKTDSNGTEVLEIVHPFTNEIVEVPLNGGDEFVKRKTREVYIIFVDNQNRTILIFKGIDHSLPSPGKITKSTDSEENIYENSTTKVKIVKDEWGSLVVGGVPKYDIDSATTVTETKQMIVDGIPVLEFAHPVTQDKIRVPLKGGDEYINETTKEIFIIFVDIQGKTLLILKHEQPMENIESKENSDAEKIISQSKGGSIVVKGIPEYNISSALIITKTNKKIGFDGTTVLEFVHPITQEIVQVPLNGGDEYVIPRTQHIFIIFVDVHKRTLLILKDTSEKSTNKIEDNIDECWGTMVVGGNPKYGIANATIVEKTRQKMKNGVSVIEFTHPITLQVINVPYKGGDEYVDPMTKQIFIIFVDILDRTILILRPSDSSVDSDEDPNAKEEDLPQTNQGSIVVGGVPKYDIASAMVVKKSEQRMKNGSLVVDFEHPISSEVIHVVLKDGDEYVDPKTKQVFIIFVDILGRTILILKRSDSSIESQQTNESNVDSDEKYKKLRDKKKWGTVVVRGVPRYYMSRAKIVMDVKKKIGSNGIPVLEFEHPITGQTIEVPVDGGDEYVNGQTREVFVICVDRQGRTLLVFKGLDTSASTNEMSNDNAASYNENSAEFDADPDLYSNVNANVVTPDSMPFEDYENYN